MFTQIKLPDIRSGVYAGLKKGRIGGFDVNRAHWEGTFFERNYKVESVTTCEKKPAGSSTLKSTLGHIQKKEKKILSHIQSMREIVEPPRKSLCIVCYSCVSFSHSCDMNYPCLSWWNQVANLLNWVKTLKRDTPSSLDPTFTFWWIRTPNRRKQEQDIKNEPIRNFNIWSKWNRNFVRVKYMILFKWLGPQS